MDDLDFDSDSSDIPRPSLEAVPAVSQEPDAPPSPLAPAANPKGNITLDDIFGGGDSDLDDDNEGKMDFSDSDDEKNVALPKFKKKQRAEGEDEPEKRQKKKAGRRKDGDPEDDKEAEPAAEKAKAEPNDFDEALNRIKHKRAKKLDGDDPEIDEMIVNLVEKMKEAAHTDQEFNRLQQPAIAKIKMLSIVNTQLAKTNLYEQFLDNNILEGMKLWLEPLRTDGSLPNLDVQMSMLTTLAKFPIRTEHLRESLIGRVIMFYSKCDRTTPSALKIVNDLLEKWMRPILGRSQNYKEKSLRTVAFDAADVKQKKLMVDPKLIEAERFTRVPKPLLQEFKVMPQSNFGGKFDKEKDGQNPAGKKKRNMLQNFKMKKRG
ncbi:Transcription factor iws1 [Podochytrium sp. JEL0797]|nr:Transcription factor iws1 [Podochytrium sp. JEL0797]